MVASAVFIMDLKGKVIISRNYRGDIPMTAAERYVQAVLARLHSIHDLQLQVLVIYSRKRRS